MPLALGSNRGDLEQCKKFLEAIAAADDELLLLRSEHMVACKTPRAAIKETMAEAKEAGINMQAFRALIAEQRDRNRISKRIAALEADAAEAYELIRDALGPFGDTPLGEAALRRAKGDGTLAELGA
jgi:hypothetical protein